MKLPENYVHIDRACAVHISTLRKFTKDIRSFMNYLKIANEYPALDDAETLKNITIRCDAPTSEVIMRTSEHAELLVAVAQCLENRNWFDDQPEPFFLKGEM